MKLTKINRLLGLLMAAELSVISMLTPAVPAMGAEIPESEVIVETQEEEESNEPVILQSTTVAAGDYSIEMEGTVVTAINSGAGTLNLSNTGATELSASLFKNYATKTGLTSIVWPSSGMVTIGASAFEGCEGLTGALNLPDSITTIGDYAFYGCTGITSLHFPTKLDSLGRGAFNGCSDLQSVENLGFIKTVGYSAADYQTERCPFVNCSALKIVSFRTGITKIPEGIFSRCPGLNEVTIPASVTEISQYAFLGCTGLTTVEYADNPSIHIQTIGKGAFEGDNSLASITWPGTLVTIGESAFNGCSGLEDSLNLSDSITTIENYAFCGCTGITSLHFPTKLDSLGRGAFNGCSGLQSVENLGFIKTVGYSAADYQTEYCPFVNCSALKTVSFRTGITKIPEGIFSRCPGLNKVTIPASVTEISPYAFLGCTGLTTVEYADNPSIHIQTIGKGAFEGDNSLASITWPDTLVTIGESAFNGCSGLEDSLDLSDSITTIENYAFCGCTGITSLHFPTKLDSLGRGAFNGCSGLQSVENLGFIKTVGYSAADYQTEYCPFVNCSALKTVSFRTGITKIPEGIFSRCSGLNKVTIPASVTEISPYAFLGCTGLTTVEYANDPSIQTIGKSTFEGDNSLANITWPDTLVTIGESAFNGCSGLEDSLDLSDSITTIGDWAFYGCTGITSLHFPYKLDTLGRGAFNGCSTLGAVENVGFVTNVGYSAADYQTNYCPFGNCSALQKIEFREGIEKIPAGLFARVTGLEEIRIPSSVTEIGKHAFLVCTALKKVYVPVELEMVRQGAFYNDVAIANVYYSGSEEQWLTLKGNSEKDNEPLWGENNDVTVQYNYNYDYKVNTSCTVMFDSRGGSVVGSQNMKKGGKAVKPKDPVKGTATFEGWYSDLEYTSKYDFNTVVNSSFTLYAKWSGGDDDSCTVTFDSQGGSDVPSKTVESGSSITKPEDPTKTGYSFGGWFTDKDCTIEWNFSDAVTTDLTLYAKWIPTGAGSYTVTFDSQGGSAVAAETVESGKTVTKPEDPTKDGYSFGGWFTDKACTKAYDFSIVVTGNITLYAKWTAKTAFTLGRDNNNWYHFDDSVGPVKGGFFGKKDYRLYSDEYFNALVKGEDSWVVSHMQESMERPWRGSCFGISSTMGLLFQGKHKVKQYSDSGADSYYKLPLPADDKKFMDIINYYQLMQELPYKEFKNLIARSNGTADIKDFLSKLYEEVKKDIVVFCMGKPNGNSAHAILAVDAEDGDNGDHVITLYDMNSYDFNTNNGVFDHMVISPDFSSFSFDSSTYGMITEGNYKYLAYWDWNKYKLLPESVISDPVVINSAGILSDDSHAMLTLRGDTTIVNTEGDELNYKDGEISGDMTVYSINPIVANEDSGMMVEVDDSEKFTLEGSEQDVSVGSKKGYMSVEGSGFDGVVLSYADGVQMSGTDYSFKTFVQTDNVISGNEKGLASISGKGNGTATIKKDGDNVKATTTGSFSDIVTTNYKGNNKFEESVSGEVTEVSVDTKRGDPDDNGGGDDNKPAVPTVTVSDNKPMDFGYESRGGYSIGYYHSVPFWGKSKPNVSYFGTMTVSMNNNAYEVTKVKANLKKGTIQITGLSGADKATIKAVKKATKGMPLKINPYYVKDTDDVIAKSKKDGTLKSVKILINGKYYKAKKSEFRLNDGVIKFTGSNLDGSWKAVK